jgi:two-component system phosphate regulon sensor histidine kinase PhoR
VRGVLGAPEGSATLDARWPTVEWLVITAAVIAVAVLAGVVLYRRLRQNLLRRVVQDLRALSVGAANAETERAGRDDLPQLSVMLRGVRRRLDGQAGQIGRQRQMLQSLLDQLQEGVVVVRNDGRIALLNPAAVRLLDLPPGPTGHGTWVGQPLEACIRHHALQRLLRTPGPKASPLAADVASRLEIETGSETVHLLARAGNVDLAETGAEAGGATPGRLVTITDMSELQHAIQMRTDFVANASHELRTPLATIRAAAETLLTMDFSTEAAAARAFLEKVDRHSVRLESLVSDLLDLSRIETPAVRFEPELVEVRRLVEDLHARFAEALERKQLHWEVACTVPEPAAVYVNPHLLRLALDNLVDNAIKFTDPGGHVGLTLRGTPAEIAFEVTDDGCGIPDDAQQRVFERFYQVERARSGAERGTGLGLSIVRHAVNALRGTVRLESKLGAGTRVTIVIPQPGAPPSPRG